MQHEWRLYRIRKGMGVRWDANPENVQSCLPLLQIRGAHLGVEFGPIGIDPDSPNRGGSIVDRRWAAQRAWELDFLLSCYSRNRLKQKSHGRAPICLQNLLRQNL